MHFFWQIESISSVSSTGCKLGHRKDHASSFFSSPFLLISLLLQLWYYLLFEQLKIRVVLDRVCHSCPSAPPLARPWCPRPQKQLALVCARCPICCACLVTRVRVCMEAKSGAISLPFLINFFLTPHIHSRANPVFNLRSLNALTATIWGQGHWYTCLETTESYQDPATWLMTDGKQLSYVWHLLSTGILYNPFLNERKETQR